MSLSRILNDPISPPPRSTTLTRVVVPSPKSIPVASLAERNEKEQSTNHLPGDVETKSTNEQLLHHAEPRPRKRRRNYGEEADTHNSGQRRFSTRIHSQSQREPTVDIQPKVEEVMEPTEEELRLSSSDLDDCPEIWHQDYNDYILQTHRRQKWVHEYFESMMTKLNGEAAQHLQRKYAERVQRLPRAASPSQVHISGVGDRGSPFNSDDEFYDDDQVLFVPHEPHLFYPGTATLSGPGKSSATSREKHANTAKRIKHSHVTDGERTTLKTLQYNPSRKGAVRSAGSVESTSTISREPFKPSPQKPVPNSTLDTADLMSLAIASTGLREVTPAESRPESPFSSSNIIFAIGEDPPAMRRAKKVDEATMAKRLRNLQESQRKVWTNIARREVPKVYRFVNQGWLARQAQCKRLVTLASIQARKPCTRTSKTAKDVQTRGKRLMREMLVSWKKNEREERDFRKRENKEAADRAKVEDEKREAARQARKLEFLISQTELYSHFVGSKLKTSEMQGETAESQPAPPGALLEDVDPSNLREINFDDEDRTNLHQHARYNAQEALTRARTRAKEFDTQAALERKTNEAIRLTKAQAHIHEAPEGLRTDAGFSKGPLVDLDSDELNFQNPTSLQGPLTIGQPRNLMAQLKEYQLKGLNWLAMLYEQGINGILADEMGLGKTVQSIALLAYLAETHDIWGPFLVVSPASTLHNWQQELTRFLPGLKALPYWGNVKDRAILRKIWSKKDINFNKDAPFHIIITSYQLVTQDQQYFQRIKWQYMILDEAQNIKNSSSVRWKTLLGFHCRNRLLLTGTPIQNSMQELWALLHFIMPSLFDSHDEFNEWFSKDIESAAENKGSKLNEHQLRRLHMILKPFMLRRIKRNVQNELSEKIELDIYIELSARQRKLYTSLLSNVSVVDLIEKAANVGDAESARSLMNLVMQFRKVCNHPELFERADVVAPFSFASFAHSGPLNREGEFLFVPYSGRNPIEFNVPKLLYQDGGMLDIPSENSRSISRSDCLNKLLNIWSTDWIHRSLEGESSSFSFLKMLDISAAEAHNIYTSPMITRGITSTSNTDELEIIDQSYSQSWFLERHLPISERLHSISPALLNWHTISKEVWRSSCLSRAILRWHIPPAVAPGIELYCSDRTFLERQWQALDAPLECLALFGLPAELRENVGACAQYLEKLPGAPLCGLLAHSPSYQLPCSTMQVPEAKRLIYDSAKLARLDQLLQELKSAGHRVLIYFQMTRMMDLMEEYLVYRQYKYLRLDGSSKLEDRRDMVIDWQTKPDLFVFLLSTRAGGLGINLTAADTVIFYDHDWNPSNDAQAMDRAHRLGQTRQVTVYRLITRGTIDERIVQLARVKKDVQDLVVGQKTFADSHKPSEIVQLLLNDEQLKTLESSRAAGMSSKQAGKQAANNKVAQAKISQQTWNDDEDDFFGSASSNLAQATAIDGDDEVPDSNVAGTGKRGRKSKATAGQPRGRKPGSSNTKSTVTKRKSKEAGSIEVQPEQSVAS